MLTLEGLHYQRLVAHLHRLGARVTAEALLEVAKRANAQAIVLDVLEQYQRRLTPEMVRVAGGDQFPPPPMREVA